MKKDVDPKALGRRLAARRIKMNLEQGALAAAVGMTQQGVGMIEKGSSKRPRYINEIAAALRTTREWLLWGEPPEDALPSSPPASDKPVVNVPLLDSVTAGRLREPSSQIPVEKVPLLAFADLGPGEFFALRVDGTSMDRISPEGSTIVVNRRDRTLISGKAYVFALRGETTYKLWQADNPPYLAPFSTDPQHRPKLIRKRSELEVIGRVRRTVFDL